MNAHRAAAGLVGIGLGAAAACWSAGPLLLVGLAAAGWLSARRLLPDPSERRWVARWLMVALGVRLVAAAMGMGYAWSSGLGSDLFGDGRAYSYTGNYIAEVLRGEPLPGRYVGNDAIGLEYLRGTLRGRIPAVELYQVGGMGYLVGWFYAVVGYSPLMVKWLNVLLSGAIAVLLYDLARRMAGGHAAVAGRGSDTARSSAAARIALLLVIWWPSLFLWSVAGLKEGMTTFALLLPLWLVVRGEAGAVAAGCAVALGGRGTWPVAAAALVVAWAAGRWGEGRCRRAALAGAVSWASIIMLVSLRSDIGLLVAAVLAASVVMVMPWRWKRAAMVAFLVAAALMLHQRGPGIVARGHAVVQAAALRAIRIQSAGSRYPGTMYRVYPYRFVGGHPYYERVEPLRGWELLLAYLRGMAFLVAAPFPWHAQNWSQLAALPQMVASYWLAPAVLIGAGCWFRRRWREASVVLLVCLAVISAYALAMSNVGTVLRLRDVVTPYALACAATGLAWLARGVEKEKSDL